MHKNLLEKILGSGIFWSFEKLFWIIFLDNLTLIHKDHSIGNFAGKPHLMRDANHRHTIGGKRLDCIQNLRNHFWIKRRSWLIKPPISINGNARGPRPIKLPRRA